MKEKLLVVGGVASALAASSCCIVPLALVSVGVSGAWIGHLTALAPYQPIFLVLAVGCLGAGFWMVYRPSVKAGAHGVCAAPRWGRSSCARSGSRPSCDWIDACRAVGRRRLGIPPVHVKGLT